nr:hypothetical protein B0A51_07462 [Rachicladosporium sp. CCFEE 5018]
MILAECAGADMASAEVNSVAIEQTKQRPEPADQHFRFLDLSPELRLLVYEAYIDNSVWQVNHERNYLTCTPLRSVCKIVKDEFDPLHLQAQWEVRRIEAEVDILDFTRLIEFVEDDESDDSHYSLEDKTTPNNVNPLDIKLTMTFFHQYPDDERCNKANGRTVEEWLDLNRRKGANWQIAYHIKFEDLEYELYLSDFLTCVTMDYDGMIDNAVELDEWSLRPKSLAGRALQHAYRSAATAFVVGQCGLAEVSAQEEASLRKLLDRVLPKAPFAGRACDYCWWDYFCVCESCKLWRESED